MMEKKWTLSKWGKDDVLMSNGEISGIDVGQVCDKLNENEELRKRVGLLEVLLIAALPIIHEYSLSGIQDKERRSKIGTFEQEVKRAIRNL